MKKSTSIPKPILDIPDTTIPKKIPVLDITGLGTFQYLYGNEPEMELNGTRVTALFDADDRFYELSARYNSNESVPVLDFLNCQRQLKAKMFALKGGQK